MTEMQHPLTKDLSHLAKNDLKVQLNFVMKST